MCPAAPLQVWLRFPRNGSEVTPPHPSNDFKWKDYCPEGGSAPSFVAAQVFWVPARIFPVSMLGAEGMPASCCSTPQQSLLSVSLILGRLSHIAIQHTQSALFWSILPHPRDAMPELLPALIPTPAALRSLPKAARRVWHQHLRVPALHLRRPGAARAALTRQEWQASPKHCAGWLDG
jgi:hypothetical protein